MKKKRIKILEEVRKNKLKQNNGYIKVNYDNQMSDKEREEFIKQGIKIIDVIYL